MTWVGGALSSDLLSWSWLVLSIYGFPSVRGWRYLYLQAQGQLPEPPRAKFDRSRASPSSYPSSMNVMFVERLIDAVAPYRLPPRTGLEISPGRLHGRDAGHRRPRGQAITDTQRTSAIII